MKKKSDKRLAIDIGAASIKIAEFSFPNPKNMVLDKFIYEEYTEETDSSEARFSLLEMALKKILSENKFKTRKTYLSISGQTTFIRFIKLPPASEREQQVKQLVAFEARQNIPYPLEEVTWDYQLISPIEEGGEINVMFAVIKNDIINNLIKILENNKLTVELVDITPTTFYNAAKANRIGENEPAMILNMGSFCSTLVFINQNHFYARTIPVAGYAITQQIMKELNISFNEAETMKRNIGFVALGGAYEDADSEAATIVSKIIRNIMIRLHSEINRSINVYRSQQKAPAPKKLYLAGGSSIINFSERFLSTKLKMETEYFNPFNVVKISNSIDRNELASYAHMTAEVIGLGLRHITTCPIEISLLPKNISQRYFIQKKIPYFTAICFMVIICFSILLWGEYSQLKIKNELIKSVERDIGSKNKTLKELEIAQNNLKKEKALFNTDTEKFKGKNYWPGMLNEFQNCLPDNTWLVAFTPYCKAEEENNVTKDNNQTRRTLFSRNYKQVTKPVKPEKKIISTIDWIKIKGHSLLLNDNQKFNPAEILKQKLLNSKYFSNSKDDIIIKNYTPIDNPQNNITTFEMDIKLKTPVKI